MEKVIMNTSRMDNGFSCACDLLPGLVVAYTGDMNGFLRLRFINKNKKLRFSSFLFCIVFNLH
nr:hypothetical protein [Prevotella sp.]